MAAARELIMQKRGKPQSITCDNGSEFASRAMDAWAWQHQIRLVFITPRRLVENGYIEPFNGRLWDEVLNVNLFFSLADVRQQPQNWQKDYNVNRSYSAPADQTSNEVVASWNKARFAFLTVNKAVGQPAKASLRARLRVALTAAQTAWGDEYQGEAGLPQRATCQSYLIELL